MNRHLILMVIVLALVLMPYGALPTPLLRSRGASPASQANRNAALSEGALEIYTSLNDQEARLLLDQFRREYPFLKVDYLRASSAEVLQKVLTEAKAGTPPDVVELDGIDMSSLYKQDLLAAYTSAEAESFPESARHPYGYYTTCYFDGIVIAYNTRLVNAEAAPRFLGDLLDARWTGKIGIEAADWVLLPLSAQVMGDQPSNDFWTKLGKQQVKVIKGHGEVATAVANGDVAVSPTAREHWIEALKQRGQPVEWVRTDPVYTSLNSVAITAHARHPNAARVFVDWLLSAQGQTTVAAMGRIPIRPGIQANPGSMTEGVHFYYGDPMLIADANRTRGQHNQLLPVEP